MLGLKSKPTWVQFPAAGGPGQIASLPELSPNCKIRGDRADLSRGVLGEKWNF